MHTWQTFTVYNITTANYNFFFIFSPLSSSWCLHYFINMNQKHIILIISLMFTGLTKQVCIFVYFTTYSDKLTLHISLILQLSQTQWLWCSDPVWFLEVHHLDRASLGCAERWWCSRSPPAQSGSMASDSCPLCRPQVLVHSSPSWRHCTTKTRSVCKTPQLCQGYPRVKRSRLQGG